MSTETVRVDWIRDKIFLMRDRSDFPIVMTQPSGVNGADLLPLSVIGCAVWDVVSILQKQRQQITDLQVTAESVRDDEPPWRFRKITIRYKFTGRGLTEEHIKRAIELTETKYCSTFATLRNAVEMVSTFEIVQEDSQIQRGSGGTSTRDAAVVDSAALLVTRFNDALNAHDVDTMVRLLSKDCIFENTFPAPDGTRYEGQQSVRAFWEEFFRTSREPMIEIEEMLELGDRCIMRWTYHWLDEHARPAHVRGIDLYRVRDGLISEKLSYVKG